jgi:hypothetical protein
VKLSYAWISWGSAKWWMWGHILLGTLSLPLIHFHAGGFRLGGSFTTVLMVLLYWVVLTGLAGAALQHALPRYLLRRFGNGAVYSEVPRVLQELRDNVWSILAPYGLPREGQGIKPARPWRRLLVWAQSHSRRARESRARVTGQTEQATPALDTSRRTAPMGGEPLIRLYHEHVREFLEDGAYLKRSPLADPSEAEWLFSDILSRLPEQPREPRESIIALGRICALRRDMFAQQRVHWWLRVWLLAHVPPCVALALLGVIHAIFAVRY